MFIPLVIAIGGGFVTFFVWYYMSPYYYEVGYVPKQPIQYSHALHAGELGIDCRYCHATVDKDFTASIPSTATCMNCHTLIKSDSEKIAPLKYSYDNNLPVEWVRVHDLPDYSKFNHAVHIKAQIGCASCHGDVQNMEVVYKAQPLSMGWCLDCHRNPQKHVRPKSEIYNTSWKPGKDHQQWAEKFVKENNIKGPENCTACHY